MWLQLLSPCCPFPHPWGPPYRWGFTCLGPCPPPSLLIQYELHGLLLSSASQPNFYSVMRVDSTLVPSQCGLPAGL